MVQALKTPHLPFPIMQNVNFFHETTLCLPRAISNPAPPIYNFFGFGKHVEKSQKVLRSIQRCTFRNL